MTQEEFENQYINKIHCSDCLELMKDWPDSCIDLISTDPPYGINIAEWDKEMPIEWFGKAYNTLKPSGAAYIFGDSIILSRFQVFWENEDIEWTNRCVWVYESGPRSALAWTSKHEDCLVLRMPNNIQHTPQEVSLHKDPRWGDYRYIGNVWKCNRVLGNYNERVEHITQKPLNLMLMIIQASSKPNDLILDPFCGSGTTCVAAKMLGRKYIGIDISPKYCEIARQRLEAVDTGVPAKERKMGQIPLFPVDDDNAKAYNTGG